MAAPEAAKVSLLLPDVPLRTLDALSSGPTSPDHSTVAEVRELMARYDLAQKFPPSVRAFFERTDLPESPGNKSWLPSLLPQALKEPSRRQPAASLPRPQCLTRTRPFAIQSSKFSSPATTWLKTPAPWPRKPAITPWSTTVVTTGTMPVAARYLLERFHALRAIHPAPLPHLRRRSHRHHGSHPRRWRPQPAVRHGLRA